MRRVPVDDLVLDRDLEDAGERRDRFVDRRRSEFPVTDLSDSIGVDVLDRDLVDAVRGEGREDMTHEPPFEVLSALGRKPSSCLAALRRLALEPLRSELLE